MGIPFTVDFAEIELMPEPSHPRPVDPTARVRDDRLREGAAAGDHPAQPAGGPQRLRLPDAARDRPRLRGRLLGRRHPCPRRHRGGPRVLRRRRPPLVGGDARRPPAGVLEVVRRLQGHARPPARAREADDRAGQRDRGRRRERAPDGLRPRRHGRRRLHPPRRARARLRPGRRRDAVAPAHGRRPPRPRDRLPLRRDPRAAGRGVGPRQPGGARRRARRASSTGGSRASRASCRRRRATRSISSTSGATWPGTRPSATPGTGSPCRCWATRRRTRSRPSSNRGRGPRPSRLLPVADEVLTRRDGAVLTITFNRPEVYNAFNRELHAAPPRGADRGRRPRDPLRRRDGRGQGLLRRSGPEGVRRGVGRRSATRSRRPTTRTSGSSARSRSR